MAAPTTASSVVDAFLTKEAVHILGAVLGLPDLPQGFPKAFDSQLAWDGTQVAEADYIFYLSAADIEELEQALGNFKSLELDGNKVTRENFKLPNLSLKLEKIRRDIHYGKGFGLIRGLDPAKYSVGDVTILQLGIQSCIADRQGRQDKCNNMLVHVVADKASSEHHRHSSKAINFHNEEVGDIVAWLTRSAAAVGGKCVIASAYTVYNILAATAPAMIRTLARSDWPLAMPRFQCRPLIYHEDGKLIMNFGGRAFLLGSDIHPRPDGLPKVTTAQLDALDAIDTIAEATKLEIQTRAGDIHFINNLAILHRRDSFINGQAADQKRHLVRMLLRDSEQCWKIPAELQRDWFNAYDKEGDRIWHLTPMPEGFFPMRCNPN